MQYLSGVPQYSSDLKRISVFLEVWAGVLWTDTMSVCSASIKETLQLFAGGWYVRCLLSFEYWCEVAPVLDLERAYVPYRILEPRGVLQCLYCHIKIGHVIVRRQIDIR